MGQQTAVIYGDISDGYLNSADTLYINARDGTGVDLLVDADAATLAAGQYFFSGGGSEVYEGFLAFDTSVLGPHAIISAATIEVFDFALSGAPAWTMNARALDWGGALDSGDFVAAAGLSALPLVGTLTTAARIASSYNVFTDIGLAGIINTTGFTRLILSSSRHESGIEPTGEEWWELSTANDVVGTRPRLTITYTAPSPARGSSG